LLRGVGSCHQRTTLTGKAGGGVLVRSIAISSRLRANALAVMLRLRPSVVAPLPLLLQQPLQLELRPATIRQKVLLLMLLFQTLELPCKPLYHPHYPPQYPPLLRQPLLAPPLLFLCYPLQHLQLVLLLVPSSAAPDRRPSSILLQSSVSLRSSRALSRPR
jgi:hypothetical protein